MAPAGNQNYHFDVTGIPDSCNHDVTECMQGEQGKHETDIFSFENTEPENFSRIISPANVRSELDRSYLFGGAAQMSICSRYNIMRKRQSGRDVPGFAENAGVKRQVFDEIDRGSLLAIDEVFAVWSPLKHPFLY